MTYDDAECVFEQTTQPQMCACPEEIMREYLKIVKEARTCSI